MLQKDALQKIAQLIASNPSITVKQIAREMGYSEEKSVYYWLEKGRYYGIKQFKKAVLTGEYRRKPRDHHEVKDRGLSLVPEDLPVARGFTPDGKPLLVDVPSHYSRNLGESVYACVVKGTEYSPFLRPDDMLVIDPDAQITDGDLVLLVRESRPEFRCYYAGNLFVHPINPHDVLRAQNGPSGKVTNILRNL